MPLTEHRKLTEDSHWGIWEIDESMEALSAAYPLTADEKKTVDSFTHSFRKIQWLSSRLLLHTLEPGTRIIYDEHGKPWPEGKNNHISISHSGNRIAVMISNKACGIDIELIRPRIERIAPKFLSEKELITAMSPPLAERLHVYWCVKEAAYKVNGKKNVSLRENISVLPFTSTGSGSTVASIQVNGDSRSFTTSFEKSGGYMLAWAVAE